jgi:hypothetical protein
MMTVDEHGVPVSKELTRLVKIRFSRTCGPKGWKDGDPIFEKGTIVEMPMHMARTYVGLSQAAYTNEGAVSFDFVAAMEAAAEARKPKAEAEAKPKRAPRK